MSRTNHLVFIFLHVLAWVIFVGLCVEAGGILVNFFFSLYRPEFVENLYQKLDLSEIHARSKLTFFSIYFFIIAIAILKAYLFYIIVMLMHRLDLTRPFNAFVSQQISRISYCTLAIGILGYIAGWWTAGLLEHDFSIDNISKFWTDSQAFILMGAAVYVIAVIFKIGVNLQKENDLTV